jgi:plasmid replication initiation protein
MAYREKEKRIYNEIELSPNEYIFSIDFLRQYFNCEDKYKNTGDFMRRIIDISERAINTTSPVALYVTHRSIKRGAKIEAVIFKVTQDYGKQLQRLRGESDGE